MPILANAIHERTVKAYQAYLAHPELHPYMKPELRQEFEQQAGLVGPLLQTAATASEEDDAAMAKVEATYEKSRQTIMWIHDGARYCYRQHPDQLAKLTPLRLGGDAPEDGVRMATLHRILPTLEPAFTWLPDEGLTLAALVKQMKAHREAQDVEPTLGVTEKGALANLRAARPASQALWSDDGGRLEAWVIANVPSDKQFAFGRERRQRPRPPVKAPTTGAPGSVPTDPAVASKGA